GGKVLAARRSRALAGGGPPRRRERSATSYWSAAANVAAVTAPPGGLRALDTAGARGSAGTPGNRDAAGAGERSHRDDVRGQRSGDVDQVLVADHREAVLLSRGDPARPWPKPRQPAPPHLRQPTCWVTGPRRPLRHSDPPTQTPIPQQRPPRRVHHGSLDENPDPPG